MVCVWHLVAGKWMCVLIWIRLDLVDVRASGGHVGRDVVLTGLGADHCGRVAGRGLHSVGLHIETCRSLRRAHRVTRDVLGSSVRLAIREDLLHRLLDLLSRNKTITTTT